jgi:hypothetical protein
MTLDTFARVGLLAWLLVGLGCDGPSTAPGGALDASASPDASTSAGDRLVVLDAPSTCRTTTECAPAGLICDSARRVCVQCRAATDCSPNQSCASGRCVARAACVSSRTCPGQVCDLTAGYCVDCVAEDDCATTEVCRTNQCVPRPRACRSSRECSDAAQVCHSTLGVCVDCATDLDCDPGQWCADDATCRLRACVPGAAECIDAQRARTCDTRGATWTEVTCPPDAGCLRGRCMNRVCAPGSATCADAATRRVCNPDGFDATTAACGRDEVCDIGACVPRTCTPGSATCADASTRRVCSRDGAGYTSAPCPTMQACVSGECRAWTCTPAASRCVGASRERCAPDGQSWLVAPCDAMQSCASGECRARVCVPGETTCASATAIGTCSSDGLVLTPVPCASGERCAGAACVRGECAPGALFCDANGARRLCNGDGLGSVSMPCGAGQTCTGGGACRNPGDVCPGIDVTPDGPTVTLNPSGFVASSDIGIACGSGAPRAGFTDGIVHFRLTSSRDVLVTTSTGTTSVRMQLQSNCANSAGVIGPCVGATSPTRRYRDLPAGDYFLVIEYASGTTPGPVLVGVTTTTPGVRAPGDTCATAVTAPNGAPVAISGTGIDPLSDVGTSCGSTGPGRDGWGDVIWRVSLASPGDLQLDFAGIPAGSRVEITRGCGAGATSVGGCFTTAGTTSPTYRVRGLAAGDYHVVLEGQTLGASMSLTATRLASTRLAGDACVSAVEVTPDGPGASASTTNFDTSADVGTACGSRDTPTGWTDAIWHFNLAAPRDVSIQWTSVAPTHWQLQRGCTAGAVPIAGCSGGNVRSMRDVPAGDYYIVAERNSTIPTSYSVAVTTTATTPRLPGDVCGTAIPITPDGPAGTLNLEDFSGNGDYGITCTTGVGPTAGLTDVVFTYTLTSTRDVTLTPSRTNASSSFALEVASRCGDPRSSLLCRSARDVTSYVLPRQPPGTYFVHVTAGRFGRFSIRVATEAPGTNVSYDLSSTTSPFIDACSLPGASIVLGPGVDDQIVRTPLPFDFRYWGQDYAAGANIALSSNGFLSFDPTITLPFFQLLPSTITPNAVVSIFARDLVLGGRGICSAVTGVAPNRQWILEWDNATRYNAGGTYTFEAVFAESTHTIDLRYQSITSTQNAVVGLENQAGTQAAIACVEGSPCTLATTGSALRFTPR